MITSRAELVQYCLRALGQPVINIEVDPLQTADAIESAILMYQEYHPDGTDRDYFKHKIIDSVVTVQDASGINVNDAIYVTTGTERAFSKVVSKTNNVLTVSMMIGARVFAVNDVLTYPGGTTQITAVVLGDKDKKYIELTDTIVGVIRVLPWQPSFGDGMFDITYQLRMNDLRNLSSGTLNYFYTTMNYLADMDFILKKEKQFRFNRRMNRLYLDIDWANDVKVGEYIVIEGYRAVDDAMFTEIYNDVWLKKYATASIKKYWGAGLRKYQGITLPGGLILDGAQIYKEATDEMHDLEQSLIDNMAPLGMFIG